jgi:hypothetical protein
MKIRKMFIGWSNIKWLIKEIMNLYSDGPSHFSKKRIESGIAFIIAQWGMIFFLIKKIEDMTSSDLAIWAGMEFVIAGYVVNQIQKEKSKL